MTLLSTELRSAMRVFPKKKVQYFKEYRVVAPVYKDTNFLVFLQQRRKKHGVAVNYAGIWLPDHKRSVLEHDLHIVDVYKCLRKLCKYLHGCLLVQAAMRKKYFKHFDDGMADDPLLERLETQQLREVWSKEQRERLCPLAAAPAGSVRSTAHHDIP